MYSIEYSGQFKKSFKLCQKRGYSLELLQQVISILAEKGELPSQYKPHILSGKYAGIWECHIKADWLLLWIVTDKTVTILRTGTHSDLF